MTHQKSEDEENQVPSPFLATSGDVFGFVNCDETIERLYFYLDGELTEDRRTEIARHLDLCSPCVSIFGFEAELRKVIANRCKDRVPESLLIRVANVLEVEHARQGN